MAPAAKQHAFEGLHPAFAALYFGAVLVLSMACVQPVLLVLSVVAAVAYNLRLRGGAAVGRTLAWQVPLLLIITVLNPVFSQFGSTVLLQVGDWRLYGESLAYGGCMGCMLVATFQWFSNAAQILTADKITFLTGRFAPTTGLLLAMTMRLVPDFVRRGNHISQVRDACTAAPRVEGKLAGRLRQSTVLMGWGMEDSLETADAMRARGWGSAPRRTSYRKQSFGAFDRAACLLLTLLIALCVVCAVVICGQFSFYPVMGAWAAVPLYAPWAVLLVLPWLLEGLVR